MAAGRQRSRSRRREVLTRLKLPGRSKAWCCMKYWWVEIAGQTATAVTEPDGRWQAEVKVPAPGGPYTVKITGPEQSVVLHEVLVGDVWLCGGQSNMELGLGRVRNGDEEIKTAN